MVNSQISSNINSTSNRVISKIVIWMMPKDDITSVTGVRIDNVQILHSDGNVEELGNINFKYFNIYKASKEYYFIIKKEYGPSDHADDDYNSINHIKGDIIFTKSDGSEVCVGHVDDDVSIEPLKRN